MLDGVEVNDVDNERLSEPELLEVTLGNAPLERDDVGVIVDDEDTVALIVVDGEVLLVGVIVEVGVRVAEGVETGVTEGVGSFEAL